MNSLRTLVDSPVIERLGWTLLHSVWQGLSVAIVLALCLPLLRRRGARAAYGACCGALLLSVFLPAATFCILPESERSGVAVTPPAPVAIEMKAAERSAASPSAPPLVIVPMGELSLRGGDHARALAGVADRRSAASHDSSTSGQPIVSSPSVARPAKALPVPADAPRTSTQAEVSWSGWAARQAQQWRERLSAWLPWTVLAWSAGVVALSIWNLGGLFAVRRLKLTGTNPAPRTVQQAAVRIAQKLGLTRGVRLLQSALADSPVVIGAFKPVILLPASLITEIPAEQLESLLAHELAHVLRHDYLVNLIQSAIETLLFYHPAVWWISAQVRAERENCCDDLAIAVASDRAVYVRALASVAGARPSRVVPAASGGRLIVRLQRILGVVDPVATHPSRWLTGVAILSLCGAAIAFFAIESHPAKAQAPTSQVPAAQEPKRPEQKSVQLSQQKSVQSQAQPSKSAQPKSAKGSTRAKPLTTDHPRFPTKGQMQIKVVDSAGKPVPEAFIQVSIWTDEKNFRHNRNYRCDYEGTATIKLPKTFWILRLWAKKRGYCEEFKDFEPNAQIHEIVLPDEFAFHLVADTTLRGTVRNEDGLPVSKARVECFPADGGWPLTTQTDDQGHWTIAGIHPGSVCQVLAKHPDYLGNESVWPMQSQQKLKVTAQATPTDVPTIVLKRGVRLTVRTTDPAGKPVKGAVVIWGDDPYSSIRDTAVVTDERGSCQLPGFGEGPMRVTVVAKGWMLESRMVQFKRQMSPLDFHLKPGRKLRIRFVDGSGAPVPEVGVWVKKWRGVESIHSNLNGQIKIEIPGKADDKGVYEWDWAPDDAVSFSFGKRDFAGIEQSITADGTEHVLTINHVLQITGTVRDAVTGKEINDFLVLPILHFRPSFPSVDRREARQEENGVLAMQFDRTDIEHGIQIEAPGYETFRTTERYRVGGPDVVLDVRLKPAARYRGTVVGPDGRPVKGAHVSVSSRLEQLNDGLSERQEDVNNNHRVHSDSEGTFEIPTQLDRYDLVVVAPDGVAEVNRRADQIPGEIRLKRWASLTGRLVQSGKPVAECDIFLRLIRLSGGDEPHNFSNLTTKTAADGSFAFPRVPPVPCHVEAWLHWGRKSPLTSSRSVPLHPAPGEKIHVELGGGGIDVTGQLVAENQPPGFDYHFALNYLVARRPGIEMPDCLAGKGFEWKRGWNDSWLHSLEGRTYLATLNSWFVKPEPDGRFRISGVEPGVYDFAVNLYGTTEGCLVHPISMGVVRFTVKPGETQLDLGKVSIPSFTQPKVGDEAADFEFITPQGNKSRLTELRGKYVLVDFWATWCGPCVAKLDEIERLRKEFHGDKDLVVVGANLDSDPARAREFLKSKPLPWQHALLGDWANTDVPRRYAISSVPACVLIDPQGRILATEYSLESLEGKLKDLAKKPITSPTKTEKPQAQKDTQTMQMASADPKLVKADSQPSKAVSRPTLLTRGQMRVEVVDDGDKPLADAVVQVEVATIDDLVDERTYKCDAQGKTTVTLPKVVSYVRLTASHPGFCAEQKGFWTKKPTDHSFIADEHRFRLVRPITIGGIVRDDEGRTIAGARLRFFDSGAMRNVDAISDAMGHWRLDARPDRGTQLNSVTHPDYLLNYLRGAISQQQNVTDDALRSQKSVVVMRKGISVRGRVTDAGGKAVPDAVVFWGSGGRGMGSEECRTDQAGQFRFQVATTGPQKVAVVAKGWMPDQQTILLSPTMPAVDFQLKPGKQLRLRIVDRSGAPVPGVLATVAVWRGAYLINNWPNPGPDVVDIPSRTDKDGRLEWDGAPDDPVTFSLFKQGYANGEVTVTADGSEQTRAINPLLHISGSVVDAKTGRPIDHFEVVPVEYWAGNGEIPNIWRQDIQHAAAGQFDFEFNRADTEHCVQIEAPGYKTFRDPHRYKIGDPSPVLAVRLEPGDRFRGRVLGPDGQPASGARILLQSWSEGGSSRDITDQLNPRFRGDATVRTDRDGTFEIAAPTEPYLLQVVSPDGYAEVDRTVSEQPGDIRIKPWARVTGRLLQAGRPVANTSFTIEPIRIRETGLPRAYSLRGGKTNADGTFVIERVPPIPSRIFAFINFATVSELKSSASVPLQPKPGEAVDVTLGGNGCEITGKLIAENQPANFDYHFAINYLVAKRAGIQPPRILAGKDFEWKRGWSDVWRATAEGQAYLNTLEHWFVKPEPDGRFSISGVPPGEYDFAVALYGATEGCLVHPISSGIVHITVKPGQKQLDLGKLSIPSLTPPKVGDLAGAFEFEAPNGTKTNVAAFRGSYVLIDFWATWCGPCVAKLDKVEHLRHQFVGDHPLVVIGANLDADTATARKFLKSKPLPWQHALLGDWANTDVPRRYAVSNVPAYVLIDPNGRILANEYLLDAVEAKLKTLEKK
jgi:beta-lactamase regulating signal transducer with metallopeptidase domain/thiol-disulfide isomerase/thioredoxin/uncharacterized GH25 family protein